MSRLPLSPTGLGPLNPPSNITANPFVQGGEDFDPALSIAQAAQSGPQDAEYQEMLGRALFSTTGLSRDPVTRTERLERESILAQERQERARIAKAAADPDEPLTQEAVRSLTEQHNQRWSAYSFVTEMPSPVAVYAQKAAENDPATLAIKIGEAADEYKSTGSRQKLIALSLSDKLPEGARRTLDAQISAIDKERIETAKAGVDRTKAVGETLEKLYENKDDPAAQRVLYNKLRLSYPNLPPVRPDAKFEDYEFALAGGALGLPTPQPEQPGFLSRLIFGTPPTPPSSAPAANFAGRTPGTQAPLDTRRMSAEEKKALLEKVNQTGQTILVIRRDGSIGKLTPQAK